ncbi:hypothetical protein G3N55_06090 [Dissulfurirhabdus thermomarina]|uniref:CARDB domain-containing protein n=1 Tax=Dissulfurirhabdus thermomarina TaxID=1765737 RepID=A0A6N9TM98_DISTH|nr:hypothetical protein [Dissulfurirhabdus thermomarina]NDY42411.1 hypothetical protein [Dissulfurirhabdus thermomarina]NMX23819.1 hypothetical protein [Dissulfurirhabdus thermomarina]
MEPKRLTGCAALVLALGLAAVPPAARAGGAAVPALEKRAPFPKRLAALPDLAVTDIHLDPKCRVIVTVKNLGPGSIPDAAYLRSGAVGLQLYRNGRPWGGIDLQGFDPGRQLQRPGGSLTRRGLGIMPEQVVRPGRTVTIRAWTDAGNQIKEADEGNNILGRSLSCGAHRYR